MTKKEKIIFDNWLEEISLFEQNMRGCWKELGEMFVSRGGGDAPTGSFMNIATMVFWIVFCAAWIIISALGVMGYVFYRFGIIPEQGIPIVNEMFSL